MSFSVLGSNQGHPITVDVSEGSSFLWLQHPKFLQLSLFLMTLTVMKVLIRYFVECPVAIRLLLFLWWDWSMSFGGRNHRGEVLFSSWPMKHVYLSIYLSIYNHHDLPPLMLTLISWLRQCFPIVLTFSFSLLPYCALFHTVLPYRAPHSIFNCSTHLK